MAKKAYLECGQVANTHGVHGTVRVISWCDYPEILADLPVVYTERGGLYTPHKVLGTSLHKQFVLMDLEGIEDMDAAAALKSKTLYAAREDLPLDEGSVFIADMIGLTVYDAESGKALGELADVTDGPAYDMYHIRTPEGRTVLFPAAEEFLDRVDTDAGVYIRPIPGFFDEE